MKILNPEGSLKIGTSVDRDGEVQIIIVNPKPNTEQSVYIGMRQACDIINHLNQVFNLGYE